MVAGTRDWTGAGTGGRAGDAGRVQPLASSACRVGADDRRTTRRGYRDIRAGGGCNLRAGHVTHFGHGHISHLRSGYVSHFGHGHISHLGHCRVTASSVFNRRTASGGTNGDERR